MLSNTRFRQSQSDGGLAIDVVSADLGEICNLCQPQMDGVTDRHAALSSSDDRPFGSALFALINAG